MDVLRLAPSLVQFLEASATSSQDAGPKYMYEAFEVLENALQLLTDPESKFGLHWEVLGVLDELLQRKQNAMTEEDEETINVSMVNHILRHLTRDCFVLDKGHSKVNKYPKQTYLPETFRWDGLALGK